MIPQILCGKTFRLKVLWIVKVTLHVMYHVEWKLYNVTREMCTNSGIIHIESMAFETNCQILHVRIQNILKCPVNNFPTAAAVAATMINFFQTNKTITISQAVAHLIRGKQPVMPPVDADNFLQVILVEYTMHSQ